MNDITVKTVTEYNATVKSDSNYFKATFRILSGDERKTGYVASYKDCHYWAKTKQEAINRLMRDWIIKDTKKYFITK